MRHAISIKPNRYRWQVNRWLFNRWLFKGRQFKNEAFTDTSREIQIPFFAQAD
jgi:hypothetical protein